LKRLISSSAIQKRIKVLAKRIEKDYKGKTPVFLCVLNGAFMFLSDLIKEVNLDVEVSFIKLSSYRDSKTSAGKIDILQELNNDISRKDIIIVEDIVDTGLTIKFLKQVLKKYKPSSVRIATLLHKTEVSKLDFKIDYVGFEIENKFVVGYGLDYAQKYRNLKAIYVV
jgi:hypoxanthine phosphoribosyltransferase